MKHALQAHCGYFQVCHGVKNGPHGPNLRAVFGPIGQYIGFRLFSLKSFHWIHTKLYL